MTAAAACTGTTRTATTWKSSRGLTAAAPDRHVRSAGHSLHV
jgi:hypothetical protein